MHEFERKPRNHTPRRADGDPARRQDATPGGAAPGRPGPAAPHTPASLLHLQRTAGNAGVVQMLEEEGAERSPVHDIVGRGGGQPLDESTRTSMESAFGTSFEDVRVHTDETASKSAEAVGANAYTVGSDMVFRSGQFDPGTSTGQRTIAHELSHVIQQREGPVDGTEAPGGIRLSNPSDRFEQAAETTADAIIRSAPAPASASATGGGAGATAQLEADEAAAVPQVQRQDEDELED
jgi:hypothetical protein